MLVFRKSHVQKPPTANASPIVDNALENFWALSNYQRLSANEFSIIEVAPNVVMSVWIGLRSVVRFNV
jgi:hypothetical protein